jgi:hypothetical protein
MPDQTQPAGTPKRAPLDVKKWTSLEALELPEEAPVPAPLRDYPDATLFGPTSLSRETPSNWAAFEANGTLIEPIQAWRATSRMVQPYTGEAMLPWGYNLGSPLDTAISILIAAGVGPTRPEAYLFLVDFLADLDQEDLSWRISAGDVREWAKTHGQYSDLDRAFEYMTGRQGTCPICGKRQTRG